MPLPNGTGAPKVDVGDEVQLIRTSCPDGDVYSIVDHQRSTGLPSYCFVELYRAASRVGRSHIASVVNTIILAYAGSSLPLLILIVANNDSLGGVVTDQVVAQEIVRSVVATLGLIAAVPLTTALAALALRTTPAPHL